jgi:hypothetical protein
MSRRPLLLLPAVLAALALPATPAFAGEEDDDGTGSATLRAPQGCVNGDRTAAVVTGDNIATVEFYVDGELVRRLTQPNAGGGFRFSMRCSRVSVGAHPASAVVTFEEGATPARRVLRYQITRARQGSARFTG